MRADKKKNISKVATALLQEPLLDQREIADKTGLGLGTVNRALDEIYKQQWFIDKMKIVEDSQVVISKEFKELLPDDIIYEFIKYCGDVFTASDKIQSFIFLHTRGDTNRKQISENTRYGILQNAGFKCQSCGAKPEANNSTELEIDHIVPHSFGGICHKNNFQVLCKSCNASKGNRFIINHN